MQFGSVRFDLVWFGLTDRQTDKQTDRCEHAKILNAIHHSCNCDFEVRQLMVIVMNCGMIEVLDE